MVKRWLLVLWLALPLSAMALTFGDIQVRSKLNQPFEAVVPILSASAADLRELTVALASDVDYRRYGQEKAFFLNSLTFSISNNAILVRSREVFREPIVYLVLDMDWRKGRLVKSYPVLLDPPVASLPAVAPPVLATATIRSSETRVSESSVGSIAPAARPVTAATVVTTARAPAITPVRVASTATTAPAKRPSTYTVRAGDTLFGLAQRFPIRGSSFYQVAMTIYQENPNAFVNGNPDRIIAKSRLKVPTAVVFASSADAQAAYNQAKTTGSIPASALATTPALTSETGIGETPVTLALRDPPAANNPELERQLTTAKAELAQAQAQAAQTRSELNTVQAERAQLQREKQTLMVQVQDLEATLATARSQVANLEQAANAGDNQLRSSLAAAEQEIATLKAQLRSAQMQAATLPAQELPQLPVAGELTQELPQVPGDTALATDTLPQNPSTETTITPIETPATAEPNRETVNPLFAPTPASQNLGGNAMMVILAGGIVLAMLLLLILIRFIAPAKRKARVAVPGGGEMEVDFAEPPKRLSPASPRDKKPPAAKTADAQAMAPAAVVGGAAAGAAVTGAALAANKADEEEAVDFDNLNMDVADLASLSEDNVSPVSEADTLMQFGMYAQAVDLLQEELQHNPSSIDLRLKLAEVYHAEGEVAAFTEQANLLQDLPLNTDQITALTTMADSLGVSLDEADDLHDLPAPAQDTMHEDEDRDFGVRPADFDKDADLLSDELGLGADTENPEAHDMFDDFDLNDNLDDALDDKAPAGGESDAFNLDDFNMDAEAKSADDFAAPGDDLDMDLFKDSDSDLDLDKMSADTSSDSSSALAQEDDFANFGTDNDFADLGKGNDSGDDFANFGTDNDFADLGKGNDSGDDFANFGTDNDFADFDQADNVADTAKDDDFANFGLDDDLSTTGKNDNLGDDFANFDFDASEGFNPEATTSNPAVRADDDLFADFSDASADDFSLDTDDTKDSFGAGNDFSLDDSLDNTLGGAGLDNNFDDFNQAFQSGAAMDPEEINTQLDLASMFIDMGDKEGAQEILHNILGSAGGEQKLRAEDLLRKIS